MKEVTKSLIKKSSWVAIGLGLIIYLFYQPKNLNGYLSVMKYAVVFSALIMTAYEKKLWRYNPFEKVPKLHKSYKGIVSYNYDNKPGEKEMEIEIKQTLLSIRVILKTNEIRSASITGNLVIEKEEYVLYYIYETDPKAEVIQNNPIQRGACRFVVDNVDELNGQYWTSRKTAGDLHLKVNHVQQQNNQISRSQN